MGAVSPAAAQSNDVVNRLKRLENDVSTLNRAVYKGEMPPPSSGVDDSGVAAVNLEKISRLESDVRDLTGKMEQQAHDIQQLQQQVQAISEDTRMRLDAVEGQLRAAPAPMQLQQAPQQQGQMEDISAASQQENNQNIVTGVETGTLDAAALYEQGFAEIKREDYTAAEKSFSAFIKQYAEHPLAPNAYYWLGETYYVRKNYDRAARVFAEAYKKYPGGPKGADNLLKLGMSLAGKGEKQNACIALGQLKKEYPNGPAPILKRGDDEMATLGCS